VLPRLPLELAAYVMMRRILARNPRLIARLGTHASKRFAIDPLDCPFVFLIEPGADRPRLRVLDSIEPGQWDARIAGAMIVLAGLLEGIYDGDALFFSRDLTIEGDTAAVVALRNAIEDSELDPGQLSGVPDWLAPLVSNSVHTLARRFRSLLGAPTGAGPSGTDLR